MDLTFLNDIQKAQASTQETRVLIVDDEPAIARSIQGVLALVGLKANAVSGGYAALEELSRTSYDLVLLDLKMPDLDGTEVLSRINQKRIKTNVIVVSGESEIQKAIHVLKNGAKDFVRKPYSTDELLFSIKNVLEKIKLEAENREMLDKLEESEALHRFIVHNSPDLLYMLDRDGYFVFVNKNTIKLLGYSRKEIIGKHYTEVVYPKDVERAKLFFNNGVLPQSGKSLELRLQGKNKKSLLHVAIRAINIEKKLKGGYRLSRYDNQAANFVGSYGVARDITERKKSEELIRYQYNHDLLTGLPNRTLLKERMKALINQYQGGRLQFAVLFIDINRFKLINDTYGQSTGDGILQSLAEKLAFCIREGDTLARLGGDEFILLLPDIDDERDALTVAQKIINETATPFWHNGHEIYMTLSVGVSIFPEHGTSIEELIQCADIAVCNAKNQTKSRHCLYNKGLKNKNSTKVFVENLIRDSIKNDRFVVHYQPQIDLPSSSIHAVEALVRILAPNNKLILPGKFIDIAEETSLINDIGDIVLDKVCRDIQQWNRQGIHIQMSINISAVQLATENFVENFLAKIRGYGLNPSEFEIELTENVLVQNMNKAANNLLLLTNAGIKIAIDDFGTGYSSLSYLDQLPLNTLKLDKSFMDKISEANMEDSIIPAMISVAESLKLDFIAEGVENRDQHQYLVRQGKCIAQGFYYSKPLNGAQLVQFIDRHRVVI